MTRRKQLALGLMSGTSCDGVTAALVETEWPPRPRRFRVVAWRTWPYPRALRGLLLRVRDLPAARLRALDRRLGLLFAGAALRVCRRAGVRPARLAVIGSHGHTVRHEPGAGRSLQIGDPAAIAARTGVVTVGDFRTADLHAGGEGVPLVPFFDWRLFRRRRGAVAAQNIGGIANVTVVTWRREEVFAFDTGPGVMLIDEAVRRMTRGRRAYDRDGRIARRGRIDPAAAARILSHPYFRRRPPKSTGREDFGAGFLDRVLARHPRLRGADLVRTLTHVTAASIADAYERFVIPAVSVREVILSGGGARNPVLVSDLRKRLAGTPVRTTDDSGIPAGAKEAAAFAVLALAALRGEAGNIRSATGARRDVVLGAVYPGRRRARGGR